MWLWSKRSIQTFRYSLKVESITKTSTTIFILEYIFLFHCYYTAKPKIINQVELQPAYFCRFPSIHSYHHCFELKFCSGAEFCSVGISISKKNSGKLNINIFGWYMQYACVVIRNYICYIITNQFQIMIFYIHFCLFRYRNAQDPSLYSPW